MRFRQLSIRYREVTQATVPRLFGDPWLLRLPLPIARPEWRPRVDYFETEEELSIKLEVAGMTEDDFEILLYQDAIVIGGERSWRSADEARTGAAGATLWELISKKSTPKSRI